jgi:hypothetical protein
MRQSPCNLEALAMLALYSTKLLCLATKAMTEGTLSHASFNGKKRKTSDEKRGNPKIQEAKNEIPPMKKENPKTQGAKKERSLMKKEATLKRQGLKKKDLCWKKRQTKNARD